MSQAHCAPSGQVLKSGRPPSSGLASTSTTDNKLLRHELDLARRLARGDHTKCVVSAQERQALRLRHVRIHPTLDPPVDELTRLRWRPSQGVSAKRYAARALCWRVG